MKSPQTPHPAVSPVVAPSPPETRKVYTVEFKRKAVDLMHQGEQSATALALQLGVRRNQLYKWSKALDQQGVAIEPKSRGPAPGSEQSELTKLRRQLARANEELAILKKADAYFARHKK